MALTIRTMMTVSTKPKTTVEWMDSNGFFMITPSVMPLSIITVAGLRQTVTVTREFPPLLRSERLHAGKK